MGGWSISFLLALASCLPCTCCAGLRGMAAVKRSQQLLKRIRWQLAVPFVGLVVAGRLLEGLKAAIIEAMPSMRAANSAPHVQPRLPTVSGLL